MRLTHLRQADLNLLVVFTALAEERNATRAASRLLLSQPAVSRALQRLRDTFHDDLLIRTTNGYEPTPKGQQLLEELDPCLPRLERLMAGSDFDPAHEKAVFRIAATDHATHVLVPPLCQLVFSNTTNLTFDFVPFHGAQYEALEKGRLDLVLGADDGTAPAELNREIIFKTDLVCVVSKKSKYVKRMTLEQYLDAEHVGVDIVGGIQTVPEKPLAAIGAKRRCPLVGAYHTAAIQAAAQTELVATVPRRVARFAVAGGSVKVLDAPTVLGTFDYMMYWHKRMNTDGVHAWLRATMRRLGNSLR
jgi:DNA-binding transcriptional LysR family regulator